MANLRETTIWRAAFVSEEAMAHKASVESLVHAFDKSRENAKVLVAEIAIDLPAYTVHDIEHLDALWEIASQITGPGFVLNPVEGFILGCSFLFHDAAMTMAAYPGGMDEVKATREWKQISGRMRASLGKEIDDSAIVGTFLREQHAVNAEKLPKIAWKSDSGSRYLIDDADAREKFGDFIGLVAASHWWDHSKLEERLSDRTIPAPAPFPSSWSIDLLKLACVLRTADASQIDERRAPSLLRALRRNRLSRHSAQHWTFQNKLTQAQNRNDTLYFAALRPFAKEEATEWWLLHDTLKMVDHELRKTDDLIARRRGEAHRFSARRVANIESPENLKICVPTIGWQPVDTAFSIADIPRLVGSLGGDQLYGHDPMAAVREIIQNSMDAVRLRGFVDPHLTDPMVEVELEQQGDDIILTIRDNGVGMSEYSIVNNLLTFGTSGWLDDISIGEYSDQFPDKSVISGRYGIGFFSIFMLGSAVNVVSRRFDSSPDRTVILEFHDGLNTRPILSFAEYSSRMTSGGTSISLGLDVGKLNDVPSRISGNHRFWSTDRLGHADLAEAISVYFPASDVPVRIRSSGLTSIIDGRRWQDEAPSNFLERVEGASEFDARRAPYEAALSLVEEEDGTVVGRAVLLPERLLGRYSGDGKGVRGAVVSQGTKVSEGRFRGILLGTPLRAARDFAKPIASPNAIGGWATKQASLLRRICTEDEDQESVAEQIASLGGDIGELKFCEIGGRFFNRSELGNILRDRDEIWVAFNAAVSNARRRTGPTRRTESCISVSYGVRPILDTPAWEMMYPSHEYSRELSEFVTEIIFDEFKISSEISEMKNMMANGNHVYRANCPILISNDGNEIRVYGEYYRRNMTVEDFRNSYVLFDSQTDAEE